MIRISKAILGGIVGTALLTSMMYYVAPAMTGRTMDIAGMLGSMVGGSWALGMFVHMVNGILVFPLIYTFIVSQWLPGPSWLRGMVWGGMLWIIAQTVVMPLMGAGFFSAHAGGMRSVISSLLGHLVYGLAFGAIAGTPETQWSAQRSSDSGVRA